MSIKVLPPVPKLLIVDDDAAIRRSLSRILRMKGFEVELAEDGELAIEVAKRFKPDVLVLDIRLPGMDGVATFAAIRRHLPTVPAVFMTAYAASERTLAALELGASSVFIKPLDVHAVVDSAQMCRQTAPVLIVDDDSDLLISLSRAIQTSGVSVETAGSLKQAVESIRRRPDRVVIADVFLNDGFGYELLREMAKSNDQYSLVLVTGQMELLQQSLPQQVTQEKLTCVGKPADIESLLTRIRIYQRGKEIH